MDDKQVVNNMLYLETQLNNRIHEFIKDTLRKGATEKDIDNIKSSLEYVIGEQFGYMKR